MDKTLVDYDKNLEALELQRERLEKVMQMMGQEWEESGAGIGWLGQVDLPNTIENNAVNDTTNKTNQPLFKNILLSTQTGPSPEYLQSLLNVNEALVAQSLANNNSDTTIKNISNDDLLLNTPILTPSQDEVNSSPLITPNDNSNSNTQQDKSTFL